MDLHPDFRAVRSSDLKRTWSLSRLLMEAESLEEMQRILIGELRKLVPFDGASIAPFNLSTGLPARDRMMPTGFMDNNKAVDTYANYYWRLDPTTAQPVNYFLRVTDTMERATWENSEFYFDFYKTLLGGGGDTAVAIITAMNKPVAQLALVRGPASRKPFNEREKAILNMTLPAIRSGVLLFSAREGMGAIPRGFEGGGVSPVTPFSRRESDIMALVSQGLSNKQIGERLYISELTVKTHMTHIMRKTGARNRVELLAAMLGQRSEQRAHGIPS